MNVEELERLGINIWSDFGAYNEGGYYVSVEDAANLARRVIAAERIADALNAFAFFDHGDPDDSTQKAWETVYNDRVQDWISFDEIDEARNALTAYEATK